MAREINPPDEILRRVIFVVYLLCWTGMVITATIGLLQHRLGLLIAAVLLLGASLFLKVYGERYFEFHRLAKSFPTGTGIDEIPQELRKEVESLFKRFSSSTDWQERQEIRLKLAALVEKEALLLEVYEDKISVVHASLLR
ncbi:MAG: hypothetical protein IME97_05295 [Proteobacteria bacterium]|nr:hypothetical protein [Pseudomonadota bacterium]